MQELNDEKLAAAAGGTRLVSPQPTCPEAGPAPSEEEPLDGMIWCPRCGKSMARCRCGE